MEKRLGMVGGGGGGESAEHTLNQNVHYFY